MTKAYLQIYSKRKLRLWLQAGEEWSIWRPLQQLTLILDYADRSLMQDATAVVHELADVGVEP